MQMASVTNKRGDGFWLKEDVSRWLTQNGCYEGPDLFFVNDPQDARPFERWDNVNDEWAIFNFNHESMARRFLADFGEWKPDINIEVKHRVRTEERFSLIEIYTALGDEFMWLAKQGKTDGLDFRWTVTRLSQEDFNPDITHTELLFAFKDPQLAMVFKLTFGGVRVPIA